MRAPGFRFTIGRLMAIVLLAGLASWGIYVVLAAWTPTIPEQQAQANYRKAGLTREIAELALREYTEGGFILDKVTAEGEIALAEADLERARERVAWSDRMVAEGSISKSANLADHLSLEKARFASEQASTKRDVLLKYTRDKVIKGLMGEVEEARRVERSKRAAYRTEREKRWRKAFGF